MSLALLDTLASLATVAIVAATAVAALVQLRHMRAGNQINAMLSIFEAINGTKYRDAFELLRGERGIRQAMQDPAFRAYDRSVRHAKPTPGVDPDFVRLRQAIVSVGNVHEELGIMVKTGVLDKELFVGIFGGNVLSAWNWLDEYTAFGRDASKTNIIWQHFEYLAVTAQDWLAANPTSYPRGMRRICPPNPWAEELGENTQPDQRQ